ncbi:MAG: hypothetical protein M0P91_12175 [Sulfuricurvum sp.]|jgi:hypothetical protein|uniref:hypothetical protein n=1 Tax=Sulfuricurvum sp. TaxID=2025608 RepID=UPI0025F0B3AB|nr:hypothetical protein [Sulfuricurvum sp.]MCK9373942.1 hypothetical protein [Sulfuricurvum sp.]
MKKILTPLLLTLSLYGGQPLHWAPHHCDTGNRAASKHGGHGGSEKTMFSLMNGEKEGVARLILPDLSTEELNISHAIVTLPKTQMGGYAALVVNQRTGTGVNSAIRYLSLHGRPVKISPTKLTSLPKAVLEIVPAPLHREHDRYTGSKEYRFLLTFQGEPLPHTPLILETNNKTSQTYTSDEKGVFAITLPNDFKNVKPGRSENKPSEFLLTATLKDSGLHYQSTLSMPYYANPNDYWQSQQMGAIAIFFGFIGGLLIYRRTTSKGVKRG